MITAPASKSTRPTDFSKPLLSLGKKRPSFNIEFRQSLFATFIIPSAPLPISPRPSSLALFLPADCGCIRVISAARRERRVGTTRPLPKTSYLLSLSLSLALSLSLSLSHSRSFPSSSPLFLLFFLRARRWFMPVIMEVRVNARKMGAGPFFVRARVLLLSP